MVLLCPKQSLIFHKQTWYGQDIIEKIVKVFNCTMSLQYDPYLIVA